MCMEYGNLYGEPITITGMPTYDELCENGLGAYLNEPTETTAEST